MTKRHIVKLISGIILAGVLFTAAPEYVYAESTGTVNVDSAKVRADASTTADTVSAVSNGGVVTITEEKTDASGNVWYHVTLSDGKTGYIRSDLLTVTADTSAETETTTEATTEDAGAGAPDTAGVDLNAIAVPDGVTPSDFQKATVSVAAGKIRSDASTNDSIVATLASGDNLVMAGSKTGADSKTWYYVAFINEGTQKTGFIRSDLINPGEVISVAAPEEEVMPEEEVQEPEPAPVINNDYELVYTDDGTGTEVWYLYNHINNTREKLQNLLDFVEQEQANQAANEAKLNTFKIVIIILAALLAVVTAVLVIVIVRSRNDGYYDYDDEDEDDDDDDDEEEYVPAKKRRFGRRKYDDDDEEDEEEEEEYEEPEEEIRPRKMPNAAQRRAAAGNAPRRPVSYDLDNDDVAVAPRKKPDRKPKNFVIDDDMDYEFLNIDDK